MCWIYSWFQTQQLGLEGVPFGGKKSTAILAFWLVFGRDNTIDYKGNKKKDKSGGFFINCNHKRQITQWNIHLRKKIKHLMYIF